MAYGVRERILFLSPSVYSLIAGSIISTSISLMMQINEKSYGNVYKLYLSSLLLFISAICFLYISIILEEKNRLYYEEETRKGKILDEDDRLLLALLTGSGLVLTSIVILASIVTISG